MATMEKLCMKPVFCGSALIPAPKEVVRTDDVATAGEGDEFRCGECVNRHGGSMFKF